MSVGGQTLARVATLTNCHQLLAFELANGKGFE